MMAYLKYKQIPHQVLYKSLNEIGDTLLKNTGLRVMPVIELPDGRWLNDTTPMMHWFETQVAEHQVLPIDPVNRFFTLLMEDYADEWMWRSAINSRWQHDDDRQYYQRLFPEEFVGLKGIMKKISGKIINRHMHSHFLEGDGITKHNREHVWSIYIDTLQRLERIFSQQPFLLGDKPSFADFGFFGSMFWHFSSDPTPSRIMHEQAPSVFEWVGRMWNAKGDKYSQGEFHCQSGEVPEHWQELLSDVCTSYLPYLANNALAFALGKKRFSYTVAGYEYPNARVSPYRVWCLEQLQQALRALTDVEQEKIKQGLNNEAAWRILANANIIASHYDPENLAPFSRSFNPSMFDKVDFFINGSSYTSRKRAWDKT